MSIKKSASYRWILLPVLFSSAAVLAGDNYANGGVSTTPSSVKQATALSGQEDGFLDDVSAVNSTGMSYVGGNTRIGVGVDTEMNGRIEGSHILMQTDSSVTSGEGWLGINPMADEDLDEEMITGIGAKINHHWVSSDAAGTPLHVNKVFGAYDQNAAQDSKITAGYGQERENMFWSGHVSKGLSDKRHVSTGIDDENVYEKGFDYGVGGRAGTFIDHQLMRVQGGLDYEWGTETGGAEDTPSQLSVSGGVEKFFHDSPHSIGANVAYSQKDGGYIGDDHEADISGNVSYRYDFGGAGLFASDEQYRRVRVEIPGKTEVVKVRTNSGAQTGGKLVKHTMEMEGDAFFKRNECYLTKEAEQRLHAMLARIRQSGHKGRIRITGHSDAGENQHHDGGNLSQKRAAVVREFMIKHGFNPDELLAVGVGATQPKYNGANRHRNQRVDIEFVTSQSSFQNGGVTQQSATVEERTRVISEPRVVWRRELISSAPAWVGQALRNNIQYNQSIGTYRTVGASAGSGLAGNGNNGVNNNTNVAPVAANDQMKTAFNTAIILEVLMNDSDDNDDRLTISGHDTTTDNSGQIALQADSTKLMYTPAADFVGTDTFTYTITDGQNTSTATVTVVVSEPVTTTQPEEPTGPYVAAANDSSTTNFNTGVAINVMGNDSVNSGNTMTIKSFDTTSASGGAVTKEDGMLVYTPATGFSGTDTFTYMISDNTGASDTATVSVTVLAEETPAEPPAEEKPPLNVIDDGTQGEVPGDTYSFYSNDVLTRSLDVLSNDSGEDLEIIAITVAPRYGSAFISSDGKSVNYTLRSGYCEDHYFVYRVRDKHGNEAEARVNINIVDDNKTASTGYTSDDTGSTSDATGYTSDDTGGGSTSDGSTGIY